MTAEGKTHSLWRALKGGKHGSYSNDTKGNPSPASSSVDVIIERVAETNIGSASSSSSSERPKHQQHFLSMHKQYANSKGRRHGNRLSPPDSSDSLRQMKRHSSRENMNVKPGRQSKRLSGLAQSIPNLEQMAAISSSSSLSSPSVAPRLSEWTDSPPRQLARQSMGIRHSSYDLGSTSARTSNRHSVYWDYQLPKMLNAFGSTEKIQEDLNNMRRSFSMSSMGNQLRSVRPTSQSMSEQALQINRQKHLSMVDISRRAKSMPIHSQSGESVTFSLRQRRGLGDNISVNTKAPARPQSWHALPADAASESTGSLLASMPEGGLGQSMELDEDDFFVEFDEEEEEEEGHDGDFGVNSDECICLGTVSVAQVATVESVGSVSHQTA
eukprot:Clim_evm74s108 gene=Clim_evmTU74s108